MKLESIYLHTIYFGTAKRHNWNYCSNFLLHLLLTQGYRVQHQAGARQELFPSQETLASHQNTPDLLLHRNKMVSIEQYLSLLSSVSGTG